MSPTNLNVQFGDFLDIVGKDQKSATDSLRRIFNRDMVESPCKMFNGRKVVYARDPLDNERAFHHLITKKIEGERKYIDIERAKRLHWIKHFLENGMRLNKYLVFSHKCPKHGLRTYIYHKKLKFVVILEPNIAKNEYYLISGYYAMGSGITDIKDKYEQRLPELY